MHPDLRARRGQKKKATQREDNIDSIGQCGEDAGETESLSSLKPVVCPVVRAQDKGAQRLDLPMDSSPDEALQSESLSSHKPVVRARDKRAQRLAVLTDYWADKGIPPFLEALLKSNPPPREGDLKDEAWQMLHKVDRIFAVRDHSKEPEKKKKREG